ncbi:Chemotaxis sensory transducer [Paraburkholderia piptadeniae]|uniref:Chemotaxis sensory transducer n=2 Tax=Paraburkholderia piptadeniae TaxID=1701573 RepID=A0A1N7RRY5_9BURK|nr:Chemotaxis sensory transducer [Paraburkholderia piptadeniae]
MRLERITTDVEYVLDSSVAMISKGDLEGKITYVNRDFVKVSGYTEDEVLGAPQSILADGETPSEVFEDFLRTVKGNRTWTGVTKGRRKNGDYFWVHMTAAPIFKERRIAGFITIRCKATPEMIHEAELAYAAMGAGRKDLELDEGRIVKRPAFRVLKVFAALSYAAKMNALSALAASIYAANLAAFTFDSNLPRIWESTSCAIGIAISLASPLMLHRGMMRPLAQLKRHIDDMGEGNLSNIIETHRDGEVTQVLHALRVLQINLKLLVSQIQETTDLVKDGATSIATGNADLFARTEAQAASLEQVAASMRELIDTVTANAENARQANVLSTAASEIASEGRRAVSEVTSTMRSINDSSCKIVDIIGVIDSIAFQTNILALNAAVEAARAGEQGRGFAIVASEVRNLARRSASAAKEIAILIGNSVASVETGGKLVDDASTTITDIVASVERVIAFMGDISMASQEQSLGIAQVNDAVKQMEAMTTQNARLAEHAENESRAMRTQALKLAELVGSFRLLSASGQASDTLEKR